MITQKDLLKKAFAALLRGDTKERDRLCDLAQKMVDQKLTQAEKVGRMRHMGILAEQPDGSYKAKQ